MRSTTPAPTLCSRRNFLRDASRASGLLLACLACENAGSGPAAPDEPAAEITPTEVRIHLARADALGVDGGVLVVYEAKVIVIRVAGPEYRAFSNVCTHAGCGISMFIDGRFRCQCHGSEYDADGVNVAGPAPSPLTRLALEHDTAANQLRIVRS